ncbi:MAG: tannase/feruloyl esterase family alpha/beta hydrolase [Herpetosiphon sp.]
MGLDRLFLIVRPNWQQRWFRTIATVLLISVPAMAHYGRSSAQGCSATVVDNATAVVPGAEKQLTQRLSDLTTPCLITTGNTDQSDWATLHAKGTINPTGIPGIQIDGYFPDTSTFNTERGWNHDAQFVLRLPQNWNGKLVITGAPGLRKQFALDFLISDYVLAQGYAFASTDKGNSGITFYQDGAFPGDAVAEWHYRVTELTRAARAVVEGYYKRAPQRTYVTGISNGGYLTRFALEQHPELYDGGVDWEGTLFLPEGPNVLSYLPTTLKHYPTYRLGLMGKDAAHDAIIAAGFAPGSEFLWEDHYVTYWDLTQRTYREEFDPFYDGDNDRLNAGIPFCLSGTPGCDADYDYRTRPQPVKDAVARVSLSGNIGKPMLTLHGTLDSLLPIAVDSDVYNRMIRTAGKGELHRYYVIDAGNHVDSYYDKYPDKLRPMLPCYRVAFDALARWVESGMVVQPPPDQFVAKPSNGDVINTCNLASPDATQTTTATAVPSQTADAIATPTVSASQTSAAVTQTVVATEGASPTATPTTRSDQSVQNRLYVPHVIEP